MTWLSPGIDPFVHFGGEEGGNVRRAIPTILFLFVPGIHELSFALCSAECQNYTSLIGADRKITYSDQSNILCDDTLGPGWFRFQGAAGTRMSTSCTPPGMCSTHGTSWLTGTHPTVADGKVTRQVCFRWDDCCQGITNIQVRNCSSFYVYYFSGTSGCNHRFCGTD